MRRIYHLSGRLKHIENSLRGVHNAIRARFWAIDIDMQITKDGVIVGCHWRRPMQRDGFYDPLGIIRSSTPINTLLWKDVQRLRTLDGFRIQKINTLLATCGRRIVAYLEPKEDERFEHDRPWIYIRTSAKRHGTRVRVRAIRNLSTPGHGTRCVAAARRNGVDPAAHTI